MESDGIHEMDVIDRSMRMVAPFLGGLDGEQVPRLDGEEVSRLGAAVREEQVAAARTAHLIRDVPLVATSEQRLARLPHTTLLPKASGVTAWRAQTRRR